MSLRDTILNAADLKRESVEVPEWTNPDGTPVVVWVSMMSGRTRVAWSESAFGADGTAIEVCTRSKLLVHCLTNQAGDPIFTTADVEALEAKSDAVLSRLFIHAKKLNALGKDATDDAEKN